MNSTAQAIARAATSWVNQRTDAACSFSNRAFVHEEIQIMQHAHLRNYTQAHPGNYFPFLAFEVKADVTGGSMHHAENQANAKPLALALMRYILSIVSKACTSGRESAGGSHPLLLLHNQCVLCEHVDPLV